MFKNEYTLTVDLKKSMSAVAPKFVQYDNATLVFKILDNGKNFDLTGFTKAEVAHKRPDGVTVIGTANIESATNGKNVVRYNYLGSEMHSEGYTEVSLSIFSEDKKVSIYPFKVEIVKDLRDGLIENSKEEVGLLQELIAEVSGILDQAHTAIESANNAVEIATKATSDATDAVANANLAITNAQNAAVSAEEKALLADIAAKNANAKAELADSNALLAEESATNANNAVLGIDAAIANTNLATNNANDAANNANIATANVNEAIQATDLATQNANAAAINANNATDQALTAVADTLEAKDATELATNNANTATINANKATEDLTKIKNDALAATFNANTSATNANVVIGRANTSANNAQSVADNTGSVGAFVLGRFYKKNNLVLDNGSTWIALVDTQNNPLPTLPITENTWWRLVAQRGVDGTGSVVSVNDIFPDVNGNVTLDLGDSITMVDGFYPEPNGNVVTHTNKPVLDALTDDAGQLKYNGNPVGRVTSVNGQTGDVVVQGFSGSYTDLTEVPTEFKPETHSHSINEVTGLSTELAKKVDKATGKGLSTEDYTTAEKTKLSSIANNANNYVHPTNHPPSIITQDANNRFVTDVEKANWNAKASTDLATITVKGLMSSEDKTKLDSVENGAQVNTITSVNGQTGAITGLATDQSVDNKIGILNDDVGLDVTGLNTTAKKVVAAINEINAKPTGGDTTEIAKQINTLYDLTTGLIRYRAYDELLKQASNRIDGGTVFAHDMNGNIIGMTLDEANSQNIVIRDGKMLMIAKSEVTKTVTDSAVVASAYDTSGNGGRKLVRLVNGILIATTKHTDGFRLYKSENNGITWVQFFFGATPLSDISLASKPNQKDSISLIYLSNAGNLEYREYAFDGSVRTSNRVDANQTAVGNISLTINPEGTELHVAWASKNATYPNSFNIRYAKGVISQVDGSVTWGAVEQWTKSNTIGLNDQNPTIVLRADGKPIIIFEESYANNHAIVATGEGLSTVSGGSYLHPYSRVYFGGAHVQSSPSAIFVPKSVNGLANGRIWVVWHGRDSVDSGNDTVRVSFSDDGGVTWSVMQKLVTLSANSLKHYNASISANKDNEVFVTWSGKDTSTHTAYFIAHRKYSNGSWGALSVDAIATSGNNYDPSTLLDTSLRFSKPLTIFKNDSRIGFYGTWKEPVETPTLTARAVYDIPSTDYVGAFVKKIGATTVQAYVNDVLTDAELVDSEYQFTKQLNAEAPVKLRLELSRASTSGGESDAVTRILGGRA